MEFSVDTYIYKTLSTWLKYWVLLIHQYWLQVWRLAHDAHILANSCIPDNMQQFLSGGSLLGHSGYLLRPGWSSHPYSSYETTGEWPIVNKSTNSVWAPSTFRTTFAECDIEGIKLILMTRIPNAIYFRCNFSVNN